MFISGSFAILSKPYEFIPMLYNFMLSFERGLNNKKIRRKIIFL